MEVPIAHAANEVEADMIIVRLRGAGIDAFSKGADLPGFGAAGGMEIFVDDTDVAAARDLLAQPEISDEELAELSEEAGEEYGPTDD
jgi:enoyl-CoA hydratase/carnithine racemase